MRAGLGWGWKFFFLLQRKKSGDSRWEGKGGDVRMWGWGEGGRGGSFQTAETTLLHFATNRACVNSLFAMPRPDFADGN